MILRAKSGSLSTEQEAFRDLCAPHGIWGLARSVEDVAALLTGWGVKLRPMVWEGEDGASF